MKGFYVMNEIDLTLMVIKAKKWWKFWESQQDFLSSNGVLPKHLETAKILGLIENVKNKWRITSFGAWYLADPRTVCKLL